MAGNYKVCENGSCRGSTDQNSDFSQEVSCHCSIVIAKKEDLKIETNSDMLYLETSHFRVGRAQGPDVLERPKITADQLATLKKTEKPPQSVVVNEKLNLSERKGQFLEKGM